ncbi:hypothetical protein [Streptomyces sp. SID13726]|uniref:hypothetical protein n=1 Tax=Streptomyces sp. SID13726 TaxID=2706058 RepID=UPI0013BB6A63|nr:hypothetical protein [Streptomyces sp. SID13726]NEB04667.1 hypothetical protein [Streptomyces sp. SID13726]
MAVVGVATALMSVAGISQAGALSYSGTTCESLRPCLSLYYNSNQQGSHTSFYGYGDLDNLAGYTFASDSAGKGQPVKNNAASAYFSSKTPDESAVIYFNSNQGGACDWLWAQGGRYSIANRLNKTYNENASLRVKDGSAGLSDCYQF